jgi:hypothetical protein
MESIGHARGWMGGAREGPCGKCEKIDMAQYIVIIRKQYKKRAVFHGFLLRCPLREKTARQKPKHRLIGYRPDGDVFLSRFRDYLATQDAA